MLRQGSATVEIEGGWLKGVKRMPSPNCDERPAGTGVDLVVIHGISLPPGEFGGGWVEHLFCNSLPADRHPYFREVADLRVSSHLLIQRDGSVIQFVSFAQRAWHAGKSNWRGRESCNDFSIGIELEGCDEGPYSGAQYTVLAEVLRALRREFRLPEDAVVGHSDIAPGRKTDPGPGFEWARLAR